MRAQSSSSAQPDTMAGEADYDEMYKIVLVGDPGVGKTNLLAYYTADAAVLSCMACTNA